MPGGAGEYMQFPQSTALDTSGVACLELYVLGFRYISHPEP